MTNLPADFPFIAQLITTQFKQLVPSRNKAFVGTDVMMPAGKGHLDALRQTKEIEWYRIHLRAAASEPCKGGRPRAALDCTLLVLQTVIP